MPTRRLGDEPLARQIAAGNDHAFAVLFDRYHQLLYRYCRSLTGNEPDAQDALQSAFAKALVALREGRRNAPVRPWLFRIAHNESITIIRARGNLQELPVELEAAQEVAQSVQERERLAQLIADLRDLPERQRGALVMRELSGLSHDEISQALQVSVGAAKQLILEARRSLLEFAEGRAMSCEEIQRIVSDADGRSLRSRKLRAHLRGCASCTEFAAAIPGRRADMLALFPALPAAGAAGLLAQITGAGSGHGGSGAGLWAGTAAKGVGATISAKAAVAAGAAVVATATVGAVTVLHRSAPHRAPAMSHPATRTISTAPKSESAGSGKPVASRTRPVHGGKQHGHAATHPHRNAAHHGTKSSRPGSRPAAQVHTATPGNSATAPGHSNTSGVSASHGKSPSTHGKPVTSKPSVTKHAKSHTVHTTKARKATRSPVKKTTHKKRSRPIRHTTAHRPAKGKPTKTASGRGTVTDATMTPGSNGHGGHGNGGTSTGSGIGANSKGTSTTPSTDVQSSP